MIADSERRAIAAKLRKTRVERYNSILNGIHLGESVGVCAQIVSPHEDQVRAAADRLSDLIEPGEPKVKCVAEVKIDGERLEQLVHDAVAELTGIDHDADRTCRVKSSHEVEGDGCYAYFEYELTCGHEIAWGDQLPPSYCPECGRRVLYDSNDYI